MKRLVLLCLLASACGDDDAPAVDAAQAADAPGPDAAATATIEDFCRDIHTAVCEGLVACDCRFDIRPYDAESCAEVRTAACLAGVPADVLADLEAGRARVDVAALADCARGYQELGAACAPAQPPEACRAVLLAAAELDAPCQLAGGGLALCAGGAGYCEPDGGCVALPGDGDDCPVGLCAAGLVCRGGGCEPRGAGGDPCDPGSCAAGLVCRVGGRCGEPAGAGEDCLATDECAGGLVCGLDGQCGDGLAAGEPCRGGDVCGAGRACTQAPENRTCGERGAVGADCEGDSCAAGLVCPTDGECAEPAGEDEPCLDGAFCAAGLGCADEDHTCRALPGEGEPCAAGALFCAPGLGCRESDQTCRPPAGLGEACVLNPPDYLCADGLGCDFAAEGSICIERGGAGAACTNDRVCAEETYCEFSTLACTERLADGEPCEDGNECAAGSECSPSGGAVTCHPLPGDGEPCVFGCAGELACQGPGGACVPAFCAVS